MNHARIVLAALVLAVPAHAAQVPAPGRLDARIRVVEYNADEVVRVTGFPGYQITVQFAADERIENVALGDSMSWQVTPNKKANLLFVKPMASSGSTNMSVVTDRRNYNFELVAKPARLASRSELTFNLRFKYAQPPAPVVKFAEAEPQLPPEKWIFAYKFKGSKANVPARIYDDGRSTYLQLADGAPTPAIFAVGADKRETLVNFTVKGQAIVVDRVSPHLVLRHGRQVTHILNQGIRPQPAPVAQPQLAAQR